MMKMPLFGWFVLLPVVLLMLVRSPIEAGIAAAIVGAVRRSEHGRRLRSGRELRQAASSTRARAALHGQDGGRAARARERRRGLDGDLDYPDIALSARRAGNVLAAPSNDWFGDFELIHHRSAVWAAVIGGVPIVRSTGHGISSIYDAAGRVVMQQTSAAGPVVLVGDVCP